ncbi:hypothetical protein GCM10011506_36060 [Marivirga lumbricoides]|uniref:DNA-binding response regulator n=1 Tax=Marivirga lumbricoides TaxID=1046115 RepID=A0ABQ1MYR3_9BACT|nr:hypothetical protein GCM10011506_36060 [Marivirga lumbricoides]
MEKIKVLIVEDQLLIAADLKAKLEDQNFEVIDIVSSGEQAIEVVSGAIDLILMDIQLEGELDGIATAEKIIERYNIPIIYLSDHVDEETVKRAKKTYPANYLSKPFKISDLLRALELAFHNASQKKPLQKTKLADRIFIRTNNQTSIMVPYDDILYLEAERAYSNVVTRNTKHVLSTNMKKIYDQFESQDFIRISRSHIVNINHILGVEGNLILVGTEKLQMSSSYKESVMGAINLVK